MGSAAAGNGHIRNRSDLTGVSRAAVAVSAFAAGVTTALLVLYLMFRAAPGVIMADDMVRALAAAACHHGG